MTTISSILILPSMLFVLLAAAPADWLVTTSGDRIETRGPWRIEGGRVVFELPNRSLSSIRTSELDLEASRLATESAKRPIAQTATTPATPAIGTEEPKAALVLTSDNIAAAPAPATATSADRPDEPTPRTLRVAEWQEDTRPGDDGLRFRGRIVNDAETFAATLGLEVTLIDRAGRVLAVGSAVLGAPSLPIGESCPFEVAFPGQFAYDRVDFELAARPLLERAPGRDEVPATAPVEPPPSSDPEPIGAGQ